MRRIDPRTLPENDPAEFERLEPECKEALLDWIRAVLVPAKTVFRRSSYGMKRDFAKEPDGCYTYNGEFKGAMVRAGFEPVDRTELNWHFRVKPRRPLTVRQKRKLRLFGRGWLVRDPERRIRDRERLRYVA
jgi:hypothetical protein